MASYGPISVPVRRREQFVKLLELGLFQNSCTDDTNLSVVAITELEKKGGDRRGHQAWCLGDVSLFPQRRQTASRSEMSKFVKGSSTKEEKTGKPTTHGR
jgi:hypothetical protein